MFPTIFLLLWKPHGGAAPVQVSCALSGDCKALRTSGCEFASVNSLEDALLNAGVQEVEMNAQIMVLRSGFPTFIKVSSYTARTLGLLGESETQLA
jgi:hypothetical protein